MKAAQTVALTIATALGAGYVPRAPGTCGTVVGLLLFWGLSDLPIWLYIVIVSLVVAIGTWAASITGKIYGEVDNQRIVIDEVAGYLITMIAARPTLVVMLMGFVLFRFFDIVKPFPVDWADKKVNNAFGVMLDDILAGIYAWGVLWLFRLLFPS
jgi:Phosphatidylglycerophosphatase A and related proteins